MDKRLILSSYVTVVADMLVNKGYTVNIAKSDYKGIPCILLIAQNLCSIYYVADRNGIPDEYIFNDYRIGGTTTDFGNDSRKFLEHMNDIVDELK
ncbi:hypothetical protein QA540_05035 [Macrococcus psychrotolerans]|uniref:Uncharacterized protein n=1 Tax=Macrococcus psychrotolerans TaxID=3039389 RepID=A0AAU6RHA8_9STAP